MNSALHTTKITRLSIAVCLFISLGLLLSGLTPSPFSAFFIGMEEICDNALDDDADGLIDLNDPDCDCPVIEPVSLIPNPSFEEMDCCPSSRSQMHCATTWIQASEPTTDYIHTCGWMGWPDFPPPQPFPDGEGIMGFRDGRVFQGISEMNWKEYAGACLLSPLAAGIEYRFEFHVGFVNSLSSPPIDVTFFGTTNCENLPFGQGNDAFGCPTNGTGWVRLGSVRASGADWVKKEISVTPNEDIFAIAIGPDCPGVETDRSLYYFFDNLVLADQRSFEYRISEVGHPCSSDYTLKVPSNPDFSYQWYKDGIALPGEITPQLSAISGEGDYRVMLSGEEGCKVTKLFRHEIPVIYETIERNICEGERFDFGLAQLDVPGTYIDTFKTTNNCDSIVTLRLNVVGYEPDSLRALIFEGEDYNIGRFRFRQSGEHHVHLTSSLGCDSLVILQLDYYHLFFPTAFSPNNDGFNDTFNVFGGSEVIELENLKIFNRWGVLLYEGKNIIPNGYEGWDGKFDGQFVNSGVYIYLASVKMDDGKTRQFSGAVTLLR